MNLKTLLQNKKILSAAGGVAVVSVLVLFWQVPQEQAPARAMDTNDLIAMLARYEKKYAAPLREIAMTAQLSSDEAFRDRPRVRVRRNVFSMPGLQFASAPQNRGGNLLEGILYDAARALAVINGTVVTRGDSVGGYRVADITPTEVVLQAGEENMVLRLIEEEPQAQTGRE